MKKKVKIKFYNYDNSRRVFCVIWDKKKKVMVACESFTWPISQLRI